MQENNLQNKEIDGWPKGNGLNKSTKRDKTLTITKPLKVPTNNKIYNFNSTLSNNSMSTMKRLYLNRISESRTFKINSKGKSDLYFLCKLIYYFVNSQIFIVKTFKLKNYQKSFMNFKNCLKSVPK